MRVEDAHFYDHYGINTAAKIASIYQNISAGEIVRGGSTITEQYVKNAYYPRSTRTILQKIREALGAIIIEYSYSKDEILRQYLSTVYMGNGLYGIATIIGANPDDSTILDIIARLRYPNISESNRDTVLAYRARVAEKIGKKSTNIQLEDKKPRTSIDLFPLITQRVDKEVSRYCG